MTLINCRDSWTALVSITRHRRKQVASENILEHINKVDEQLHAKFKNKLQINHDLDRTLVSFQANKKKNGHRWYKYKEGFSSDLIRYILEKLSLDSGCILDPFAGSGAALFTASELGVRSVGIELLPSSAEIIEVRCLLRNGDAGEMADKIRAFNESLAWQNPGVSRSFPHIRITRGAFPAETEVKLGRYLDEAAKVSDDSLRRVLFFAAMCVLEDVSYTRKDGQYLRWDYRSGRTWGKKQFSKGVISEFTLAISAKLDQIANDLRCGHSQLPGFWPTKNPEKITLIQGSCLDILPKLDMESFDGLVTSPPYCNRYDYTRTYALELAMLGVGEEEIRSLRQAMLSCTVENREKEDLGKKVGETQLQLAINAFQSQELLNLILDYLDSCRKEGLLNNNGVPRMVRNYFKELAVVIFECARLLKPGAPFVMVNDNVRYQGVHIPVDLILSEIAQKAGFDIEAIWVLPIGKGNSSQQMKAHGREELRKCVYVWRRYKETSQEAKSESC
jgi:DNA modification methylase